MKLVIKILLILFLTKIELYALQNKYFEINCNLETENEDVNVIFKVEKTPQTFKPVQGKLLPKNLDSFFTYLNNSGFQNLNQQEIKILNVNSEAEVEIYRDSQTNNPISIIDGKYILLLGNRKNKQTLMLSIKAIVKSNDSLIQKKTIFRGDARILIQFYDETFEITKIYMVPITCINVTDFDFDNLLK